MPTQVEEIYLKNKNRSKREGSSAAFTLQMELPGSQVLAAGSHIMGRLEGNVCITRVTLLVKEGFNGTSPALTVADNNGNTFFTDSPIDAPIVVEADATANATVRPDPIYADGVTEFTGTIVTGGSSKGELMLVVDYTQLDTVTGLHTR